MPQLFSPLVVKGLRLDNRIVMPPMASESATADGFATEATFAYYERRASGVGLVITEHTYVMRGGKQSAKQLGIFDDRHIEGLAELVRRVHALGARIAIQISHAGAAAKRDITGTRPVGPSEVALPGRRAGEETPAAMTSADIEAVIEAFAEAAVRARKAGFDAVELHGAHGYLLNQFLSPLTNRRTDEYGGDLDGRLRLPLEVVRAVRGRLGPDAVLMYRLGADDGIPGGLTIEDGKYAAKRLVAAGIDIVDISGGLAGSGRDREKRQGYFAPISSDIKRVVEVPVIVTGGITDPEVADEIIRDGKADLVGIGRALLKNPTWPENARKVLEDLEGLREIQVSSTEVFRGKILRVTLDTARLPNGREASREVVHHNGAVTLIPVTDDGRLVMVRQFRYPAGKTLLELPAGKLDPGEDPLCCAVRELKEETGGTARSLRPVLEFYTTPGFSNEYMRMYLAEGVRLGKMSPDDDEFLELELVSRDEVQRKIEDGTIRDAKTLVGALYFLTYCK